MQAETIYYVRDGKLYLSTSGKFVRCDEPSIATFASRVEAETARELSGRGKVAKQTVYAV